MWRRALLLAATVAVAGGGVALFVATRPAGRLQVSSGTSTSTSTSTSPPIPTSVPSTTTSTAPPPAVGLRAGATGPEVVRLQHRLTELGFWLGPADGVFSTATTHAVVAFQKLAGLPPDGIAGAPTMTALDGAALTQPRSTEGHVIEIDLTHQVLVLADAGRAVAVLDISTGKVAGTTPVGRFTIYRQVDGYDRSPLGVLYRPKYFFRGVAIHGYPSVPPRPASHGCVRTIDAGMDWLWSSGAAPIGTPVWVYR